MKPVEDLGINPAPWKNHGVEHNPFGFVRIRDKDGFFVADVDGEDVDNALANGHLIAAAPKLYDELWKICFGDCETINCRKCKGAELGRCSSCPLGGARSALAEAAGDVVEQLNKGARK